MKGHVKWWSSPKGYGFIVGEDQKEYFLHFSDAVGDGRKDFEPNQTVEFQPDANAKGPRARKIAAV